MIFGRKIHLRSIAALIFAALIFASCATTKEIGEIEKIKQNGTIFIGTTGDYRPLSFKEKSGEYWGFGIELAEKIAFRLGAKPQFVQTSWKTLSADVLEEPQKFDFAIGGITITDERKKTMLMSDGYLANGKTILCRREDAQKFNSLEDIDKSEIRVMVNPGGLNEKFAKANLKNAQILIHEQNEEIPNLIAEGKADIMITEITEAPYYVATDERLASPLLENPFTHGEIGVLAKKSKSALVDFINKTIAEMKKSGELKTLCEKYSLVYVYDSKE